jgi:predicted TIM-barrel fold metal-dependent hydrolase
MISERTTTALSRRLLLAASAAMVSGCQTWPELPDKPDGVRRVGIVDTHAHLFNASDLPVAGFVKYTLLRRWIGLPLVAAVVDLFTTVVKPFSISVDDELAALKRLGGPKAVTDTRFAELATNRSLGLAPDPSAPPACVRAAPFTDELATGYDQLVALLLAGNLGDAGRAARALSPGLLPGGRASTEARRDRRDAFLSAARASRDGADADAARAVRILSADRSAAFLPSAPAGIDPEELAGVVLRTVAWAVILMQPRSHHLERYLKTYSAPDAQPVTIVNLLVDYDRWLSDEAAPGSTLAKQVEFWVRAARHYADKVTIKTFAGYCPLKHAIDRRDHGSGATYLAQLEAEVRAKRVAGLKFYPPMGFLPIGNAALEDEDYRGDDGIGGLVLDEWRASGTTKRLGVALDEALEETYALCVRRGIPVLAHAGPSNYTAKNFAPRPDPAGWGKVAEKYADLHVMLGHFAFDAGDFVKAMNGETPKHEVWAIKSTAAVLKAHPNIYVDLAYVNEILGRSASREKLAREFFHELRRWAKTADPRLKQITYGSDWIMLQREADHARYLEIMRREAQRPDGEDGWTAEAVRRLFVENAESFLSPRPTEPFR